MRGDYPKRLIEGDLPIFRISAHARREKSIRHGHISTLHIWWARRPLAACRAVILASLWPDPVDLMEWAREGEEVPAPRGCKPGGGTIIRPSRFLAEARQRMVSWAQIGLGKASAESGSRLVAIQKNPKALDDPAELRKLLLDFIADFANWDNSTVKEYLDISRALTQAAHEALGGAPGTRPLVVDPFAGGGSIPLEALRVGADAFASDLNPVPVLLNKVILEYIPKNGEHLAEEVRKWGERIRREAEKELGDFYPKDTAGSTPVAYIWARTIQCEGPSCGAELPLFTSPWLSKKVGRYKWLKFSGCHNGTTNYEILEAEKTPTAPISGTVRKGAATCPVCGYTTPISRVKKQLVLKRGGAQQARLLAVVSTRKGGGGRQYRPATKGDMETAGRAAVRLAATQFSVTPPTQRINPVSPGKFGSGIASPTRIGCETFADLFTRRQLLALCCFASQVARIPDPSVRTLLAFAIDRLADYNSAHSRWAASGEFIGNTFGRQALPIVWSFAEINPFSGASGDWDGAIAWIGAVVKHIAASVDHAGHALPAPAAKLPLPDDAAQALVTDPPYYGSILYSDLADYFYVWLKQTVGSLHTDLFRTELIEKVEEAVATPTSPGPSGIIKDAAFFESAMSVSFADARRVVAAGGIGTVVFAHKSTSGWEAILAALVQAGWVVTGSWPLDTERQGRTNAQGTAALASSVHLVCRPREALDGSMSGVPVGDWRDVLQELPLRIHEWMPRLAAEGVVGADAIFACLGPALEVFSRYFRVEKASGEVVELKEYLEQVWAAVAKEALTMVFAGADASGFEPDARLTAMWLWTLNAGAAAGANGDNTEEEESDDESDVVAQKTKSSGFILEYDAARKIAQGLGAHLEDLGSLVEVSGETARLLPVSERTGYLFGKELRQSAEGGHARKKKPRQGSLFEDLEASEAVAATTAGDIQGLKLGATVLDRVHQSMILFAAGRGEALKRSLVEDGVGKDARFWRLADALAALYPRSTDERRWVEGVLTRKKSFGF
jgi:putative DNA methylase